jgi:hypothetical protein
MNPSLHSGVTGRHFTRETRVYNETQSAAPADALSPAVEVTEDLREGFFPFGRRVEVRGAAEPQGPADADNTRSSKV